MWNMPQLLLTVLLYLANHNQVNLATDAFIANKAGFGSVLPFLRFYFHNFFSFNYVQLESYE